MKKRHKGRALKGTNGHDKEAQRQGAEWSGGKLTHLYGRHIRTLHGHEKEAQRQGAEGTNGLVNYIDQQSQDKNRCGQLAVGSRHSPLRLQIPFLTHGSSVGGFVSHCYRSDGCYGEPNMHCPLVQFKVVAVAMQPRFHHIQHLNEVTIVGQHCTVGHQCKMAERVKACASPSTERVHF